jgi:propanol-preferring alcohol dehydrogenase
MKAAVVRRFGEPLVVEDLAVPEVGPGEILVRTEASGLCHTDIHAAHGDWPVKPSLPFVPGHEGVGIVERVGDGVTRVTEGDRVAVPWLGWACGECEYCASGWETLCERQRNTGYSVDGGFAEYVLASGAFVGLVPDGIDPHEAAPLTCAGVTTYKAVKVSGARSSDLVAVYGVGGLGHMAVQYARIAGATVVAVDLQEDKLQMAKELGAAFTVNAATEDPAAAVRALGGADAAIVTAASPGAFRQAYGSLRRGGSVVFVGLPRENAVELPIFETVLNGTKILGSIVGTRVDLAEVFELHR